MKKIFEIIKERKFKYICFFWTIISIQFVLGGNLQTKGYSINSVSGFLMDLIKIIGLTVLFTTIHYLVLELVNTIKENIKDKKSNKREYKKLKHRLLIYFLIIIICWIPTLLAFYPCITAYDGGWQVSRYFFDNNMHHHPILITKLYTMFYVIGLNLESATIGMFLFSITQMIFMAFCFSYTVKFVEDETQNKALRNLSILFYAIFPYNQLFPMTTTKDVIYAGLFLTFIIHLYKMLKEKYKTGDYIFITIVGIIMLLSRNNAMYTLVVSLPFIIITLFKNKKKTIKVVAMFLIIIVAYKEANSIIYKSVQNANEKENKTVPTSNEAGVRMSVFSQAVGRVARDKKDELTDEEKEKISYYFTDYELLGERYLTNIADSSAGTVRNFDKNKDGFLDLVVELGKKYPLTYVDSFLDTTRGYWYILDTSFSEINLYEHPGALELYHYEIGKSGKYEVKLESKLPHLREFYMDAFCNNKYRNVPVLYLIFQPGTYFYLTIAFLLYAIYKRDKDKIVIAIVLFTFFASCFLAYCSIVRYMYPIIVNIPIMVALLFSKKSEEENIDEVKNEK